MTIGKKIKKAFFRRVIKPAGNKVNQKENKIAEKPNAITANEQSPTRFDIPLNIIERVEEGEDQSLMIGKTMPIMLSNIKNIKISLESIEKNSEKPKETIDDALVQQLKDFCKSLGVVKIGFTKLPRHLIFKDKVTLHDNAIVLVMEMDKEKIALAPHRETIIMIMDTYNKLGITANKVATFLREHGYSAHASHPLGGIVLYPPLAKKAGLGWFGRHGLLITPEFGPRVRLAAVFTNITNLPFATENPHEWIPEYCATCGKCIKNCPPKAIYEQPIPKENGLLTHIENEKCFPYFAANYGCTVCIKVCPFNTIGYERLIVNHQKLERDSLVPQEKFE